MRIAIQLPDCNVFVDLMQVKQRVRRPDTFGRVDFESDGLAGWCRRIMYTVPAGFDGLSRLVSGARGRTLLALPGVRPARAAG